MWLGGRPRCRCWRPAGGSSMNWGELTEAERRRILEAARRKHPDSVAVLALSDWFCKRPLAVQLSCFACGCGWSAGLRRMSGRPQGLGVVWLVRGREASGDDG